jgi:hypothetical protein
MAEEGNLEESPSDFCDWIRPCLVFKDLGEGVLVQECGFVRRAVIVRAAYCLLSLRHIERIFDGGNWRVENQKQDVVIPRW